MAPVEFRELRKHQLVRLSRDDAKRDPQEWCEDQLYDVVIWAMHTKTFTVVGTGPGARVWDLPGLVAQDVERIIRTCTPDEIRRIEGKRKTKTPTGRFGDRKRKHSTAGDTDASEVKKVMRELIKEVESTVARSNDQHARLESWEITSRNCLYAKVYDSPLCCDGELQSIHIVDPGVGVMLQQTVCVTDRAGVRYVLGEPRARLTGRARNLASRQQEQEAAANRSKAEAKAAADKEADSRRDSFEFDATDGSRYQCGAAVWACVPGDRLILPALVVSAPLALDDDDGYRRRVEVRFLDGQVPSKPLITSACMWPHAEGVQNGYNDITDELVARATFMGTDAKCDRSDVLRERNAALCALALPTALQDACVNALREYIIALGSQTLKTDDPRLAEFLQKRRVAAEWKQQRFGDVDDVAAIEAACGKRPRVALAHVAGQPAPPPVVGQPAPLPVGAMPHVAAAAPDAAPQATFDDNDLVWACVRGWPPWPAQILERNPQTNEYSVLFLASGTSQFLKASKIKRWNSLKARRRLEDTKDHCYSERERQSYAQAVEEAERDARQYDSADSVDEDAPCTACGDPSHADQIVVCDGVGCSRMFHIWCLTPALPKVPDEDKWFCENCRPPAQATGGANGAAAPMPLAPAIAAPALPAPAAPAAPVAAPLAPAPAVKPMDGCAVVDINTIARGERVVALDCEGNWIKGRAVAFSWAPQKAHVLAVKIRFDGWDPSNDEFVHQGGVCKPINDDFPWESDEDVEGMEDDDQAGLGPQAARVAGAGPSGLHVHAQQHAARRNAVRGSGDGDPEQLVAAAEEARAAAEKALAKVEKALAKETRARETVIAEAAAAAAAAAAKEKAAEAAAAKEKAAIAEEKQANQTASSAFAMALAEAQQKAAAAEAALAPERQRTAVAEAAAAQARDELKQLQEQRAREMATAAKAQAATDATAGQAQYGLLASFNLGSFQPVGGSDDYSTFTLYDVDKPEKTPPMLKALCDELVHAFRTSGKGGVPVMNPDGRTVTITQQPNAFADQLTRIELIKNEEMWQTFSSRIKLSERQRMSGAPMFNPQAPHNVDHEQHAVREHLKTKMKFRGVLPFERACGHCDRTQNGPI